MNYLNCNIKDSKNSYNKMDFSNFRVSIPS